MNSSKHTAIICRCHGYKVEHDLDPRLDLENYTTDWKRVDLNDMVHVYRWNHDDPSPQRQDDPQPRRPAQRTPDAAHLLSTDE